MIRLHERITVPRSVAECYRYLADFSTCEQWDPGVYRASKTSPGAPAEGTVFDLILSSAGRRVPMTYRMVRMTPHSELVLHGEGDGFRVVDTLRFRHAGNDTTTIDYVADMTFTGPVRRLGPLLERWLKRMGRRAVTGLANALTPQQTLPQASWSDQLGHSTLLPAFWAFTERGYLAMPDKSLSDYVGDRTYVITGPTGGLGLAAACELARLGARLLLVGRDAGRLAQAAQTVRDFSGCAADKVVLLEAELSLLSEVARIAPVLREAAPRLDGLINNAGALFAERDVTSEGHERALAINLLAPWRLTELLMPSLRAAGGRVINVASGGMYGQALQLDDMQYTQAPYSGSKAYARAKRALVSLTEHWAAQHPQVTFHSMHPGWAATPGVAKSLPAFNRRLSRWLRDSRMGADTMVWLATAPATAGGSGQFWFDRLPRPTAVLPGTAVTPAQQQALLAWLAALEGADKQATAGQHHAV